MSEHVGNRVGLGEYLDLGEFHALTDSEIRSRARDCWVHAEEIRFHQMRVFGWTSKP